MLIYIAQLSQKSPMRFRLADLQLLGFSDLIQNAEVTLAIF